MTTELKTTTEANNVLAIIERVAMNPDADIQKMEKLLEMRNIEFNRQAAIEFNRDFAAMQVDLPEIVEATQAHNYKYASFEHVMREVRPLLKQHGFGVLYRIAQSNENVTITARLMHICGHVEETSITLPLDLSGSKNKTQAVGSTISYGKRYTLLAILNISTIGEDDDAASRRSSRLISDSQQEDLKQLIMNCPDATREWFAKKFEKVGNVPQSQYASLTSKLKEAIQKAKGE